MFCHQEVTLLREQITKQKRTIQKLEDKAGNDGRKRFDPSQAFRHSKENLAPPSSPLRDGQYPQGRMLKIVLPHVWVYIGFHLIVCSVLLWLMFKMMMVDRAIPVKITWQRWNFLWMVVLKKTVNSSGRDEFWIFFTGIGLLNLATEFWLQYKYLKKHYSSYSTER